MATLVILTLWEDGEPTDAIVTQELIRLQIRKPGKGVVRETQLVPSSETHEAIELIAELLRAFRDADPVDTGRRNR